MQFLQTEDTITCERCKSLLEKTFLTITPRVIPLRRLVHGERKGRTRSRIFFDTHFALQYDEELFTRLRTLFGSTRLPELALQFTNALEEQSTNGGAFVAKLFTCNVCGLQTCFSIDTERTGVILH